MQIYAINLIVLYKIILIFLSQFKANRSNRMQCLVYLVLIFTFYANSASIPSYVNLCKRNDPNLSKCVINTFNEIRPYLKKGIPEMNIPPSDPMSYYDVSANSGKTKSLHFQSKAWNQVATGLMDVEIKNITFDFDKATCLVTLVFPFVTLRGDYNIDGRVLLFEINSTGKYISNNTNLVANAEFHGNYLEKDGKKYLKFETIKPGLIIGETSIYFTDLIPGNELLTNTLNTAINDNIKDLYDDLAPEIEEVFGGLAKQYFNNILSLFPINELFPQD